LARLVLVPTPIGNLQDITLRGLETLRSADVIAAEDTRHSRKLLSHFGIHTPLVRLDQHTIKERAPAVLAAHNVVAFITDAGTPGISDPGAELVRLALERGDEVEALPGPTALIPALVLSGLPIERFTFEGFLPRKGRARAERLEAIAGSPLAVALYESPKRVLATLIELIERCGPGRRASLSRELSKRFETTLRGSLVEIKEGLQGTEPKGEVVLVVGPAEPKAAEVDYATAARRLAEEGLSGGKLRRALQELGAPRNLAYELSLELSS
jgi:16S rRNA (cytidine1402-2'-O)-methyltransferase